MTNSEIDPALQRILNSVPGWTSPPDDVQSLSGGITNRNFMVRFGDERFVVRVVGQNTEFLGIDRAFEYEASTIAAELGIGAGVYVYLPEHEAMVTHFVNGVGISAERAASTEVMGRIMKVVRTYHEGPAFSGHFSAFEIVRSYETLAVERGVVFPDSAATALARASAIETALGPVHDPVPCHNDLLAANFLEDGEVIHLLDWEYAGMGDRFFDLGNFAANQELDATGCENVLRLYFGHAATRDLAHLHLMRIMSDLRESFWGFLQSGLSNLDFDFTDYAHQHLGRFLQKAGAPEVDSWMTDLQ
jgi:thiamine kinase-like enzyme